MAPEDEVEFTSVDDEDTIAADPDEPEEDFEEDDSEGAETGVGTDG